MSRLLGLKWGLGLNAYMNIYVRVQARNARQELSQLRAQVRTLEGQLADAEKRTSGPMSRMFSTSHMTRFGNRMQWVGRQIETNFTLPILLAAGAAAKWELDNQKATARLTKVYGDATHGVQEYAKELKSLDKAFVALSNHYGVAQSDTINIAADWAAAGSSGLALARSVELTMKTIVLGEMNAKDATEALIAVQAQYGMNTEQLTHALNVLNMVENQTGISMAGLIQGFQRAAGVAAAAGIDVEHLAAMLAALVPSTGGAAQAGNALKTIISRLLSPTKEATALLKEMGITTSDIDWKSANASQRLELLANRFKGLSEGQKAVASSFIASRLHINRFEQLMKELVKTGGYYDKALKSVTTSQADLSAEEVIAAQAARELNTVLESNPQRLKQLGVMLQNLGANIIQPLIPVILGLAYSVERATNWFGELNPAVQKLALVMLLLLATVGPVTRYIGALQSLGGILLGVFGMASVATHKLGRGLIWLLGPFRMLGAAGKWALGLGTTFTRATGAITAASRMIGAAVLAIPGIILAGARMAGVAWRGGLIAIQVITAELWAAVMAITQAAMIVYRTIVLAGSMTVTAIWTAVTVGIPALTIAMSRAVGSIWRVMMVGLMTTTAAFGRGILALWTTITTAIKAIAWRSLLTNPYVLAVVAIIAAMIIFWDQIKTLWDNIVRLFTANGAALTSVFQPVVNFYHQAVDAIIRAFNRLPKGVQDAMMAVVRVVRNAALAVYELFKYINPFEHHSPSLVENMQGGMDAVGSEMGKAPAAAQKHMGAAYNHVQKFAGAVTQAAPAAQKAVAQVGPTVRSAANAVVAAPVNAKPAAAASKSYDQLKKAIAATKVEQAKLNVAINEQQRIVDRLNSQLDIYNAKIDMAQKQLDKWANSPIKGEKAMNDAIFSNEQAQKKLRLEMMRMEDAVGPLDKLQARINGLQGEVETLTGIQAELRSAGAGSEITGQIEAQIKALEGQQAAIAQQTKPLADMNAELQRLQREAEKMDLEKSLKFDALHRQIDEIVNGLKEFNFSQILNGVTQQKAAIDQLTAARDALQSRYDLENLKLKEMKLRYDDITASIRTMTAAKGEKGRAKSVPVSVENFRDAAGGNFPTVTKENVVGREGGLADQAKLIDDYVKGVENSTKEMMGKLDPFGPITRGWQKVKDWWGANIAPMFGGLGNLVSQSFNDMPSLGGGWLDKVKEIGDKIWDFLGKIWVLIGPLVKDTLASFREGIIGFWKEVEPSFKSVQGAFKVWWEFAQNLWTILKPILGAIIGLIVGVIASLWKAFNGAIQPVFKGIGAIVGGVIKVIAGSIKIASGIFNIIFGLISGIINLFKGKIDFSTFLNGFKALGSGIWDVIVGIFKMIKGIIVGVVGGIIGAIVGLFKGIVDAAMWLSDVLVGHSIIPDMINAILDWFRNLWNFAKEIFNAGVEMVKSVFMWLWHNIIEPIWKGIKASIAFVVNGIVWYWNLLKAGVNALGKIFNWLWEKVVSPVWNWIKKKISDSWEGIKVVWNLFKQGLGWVGDKLMAVKGVFLNFITKGLDVLKNAFNSTKDWIGKKWGELQNLTKKPISFMVNTVYNKGILGVVNKVAGWVGMKGLSPIKGFASGGKIAGPGTGTSDSILAALSNGEHVWTADEVKKLGGHKKMYELRNAVREGMIPAFKGGGLVEPITNFAARSGVPFNVTSGMRNTNDYHGRGMAVDMASSVGNMVRLAKWLYQYSSQELELIHSGGGGFFVKNGKRVGSSYYKSEIPSHFNHVHLAMNQAGINGAKVGGAAPGGGDGGDQAWYERLAKGAWNKIISPITKRFDEFTGTGWGKMTVGMAKKIIDQVKDKIGLASGGVTNGAALVGEGRRQFPEFVIPTDPAHRRDAIALHAALGRRLGIQSGMTPAMTRDVLKSARAWSVAGSAGVPGASAGGILLNANRRANVANTQSASTVKGGGAGNTTININGDLVMPNIKDKNSAKTLIDNLEALAGR